jgi:NAD-dependent SIR2 family protein deacetylase
MNQIDEILDEVQSVTDLLDGLAHVWGDEGVFRTCRDRLKKLIKTHKTEDIICDHSVIDGDYCEACNDEYKQAIKENAATTHRRRCPKCGAKGEMFTPDLDWCPSCKYTWSGT